MSFQRPCAHCRVLTDVEFMEQAEECWPDGPYCPSCADGVRADIADDARAERDSHDCGGCSQCLGVRSYSGV